MKKRLFPLCAAALALLLACQGCAGQPTGPENSPADSPVSSPAAGPEGRTALVPHPLPAKAVTPNPYMAASDNSIHNDVYATDVTDAVAPLGIYSRVTTSTETQNIHAPSAAFYDSKGNAITPFLGGISITDLTGDTIQRAGSFVPARDSEGGYALQISYSFVDSSDHVVAPTSHGHILVLQTMDEQGEILPVFEPLLDINVMEQAAAHLGEGFDQNLLSIVYDYEGNLWFTTGGFRIYPDRQSQGFLGYISRSYMQQLQTGQQVSLEDNIFFYPLEPGEGAENGIAANEDGAVILTNLACYMLTAEDGVSVSWRTSYESSGANDAQEGSGYTGGGLAWGSGTSPTLTRDLVIFTDNQDPIQLIALSSRTGEIVAQIPVLDQLGEDVPVSVENSILVYDPGDGSASVIVCNWFGAGNSGLADPDADSSIQSYDNIYDANWMSQGNVYIAPGVERVDFVKTDGGYTAEKVWSRADIHETTMIKLSTATGYLYGYWQDLESGMWVYEVLDFDSGETLLRMDVSQASGYNNLAVGVIPDPGGNALYCPTGAMEMVCWQDVLAYLPDSPAKEIPPADTGRVRLADDALGADFQPAGYLTSVTVENLRETQTLALRVNGLEGSPARYTLFFQDAAGALREMSEPWSLCADGGQVLEAGARLAPEQIYEIRFSISDGSQADQQEAKYEGRFAVVLARQAAEAG
ncbi:hypothetical protein [uncultured Flavonifractor sp.]|uniref:hypothetical protein n=1 Tax=uncultured Flavonifractor sp. TaxID=1193534 RepID=UPI0026034191|nr:hypothetical protein [uncultured Flavonifractor sp.]